MGAPRLLDDLSTVNGSHVITREGLVTDNTVQAFVSPLFPPKRYAFAVVQMHQGFKERLFTRGQLYLVVEHPHNRPDRPQPPEYCKVKQIDFRTFVLDEDRFLPWAPKPGACINLLLGIQLARIDGIALEAQEKSQIRWV